MELYTPVLPLPTTETPATVSPFPVPFATTPTCPVALVSVNWTEFGIVIALVIFSKTYPIDLFPFNSLTFATDVKAPPFAYIPIPSALLTLISKLLSMLPPFST